MVSKLIISLIDWSSLVAPIADEEPKSLVSLIKHKAIVLAKQLYTMVFS